MVIADQIKLLFGDYVRPRTGYLVALRLWLSAVARERLGVGASRMVGHEHRRSLARGDVDTGGAIAHHDEVRELVGHHDDVTWRLVLVADRCVAEALLIARTRGEQEHDSESRDDHQPAPTAVEGVSVHRKPFVRGFSYAKHRLHWYEVVILYQNNTIKSSINYFLVNFSFSIFWAVFRSIFLGSKSFGTFTLVLPSVI